MRIIALISSLLLAVACGTEPDVKLTKAEKPASAADSGVDAAASGGRDNAETILVDVPDSGPAFDREEPNDVDAGALVDPEPRDPAWSLYATKCSFSFYAPKDLEQMDVRGTDSCIVRYEGGGCSYDGDYGLYSGTLDRFLSSAARLPGFRAKRFRLDDETSPTAALVTSGPSKDPQQHRRYAASVHVDRSSTVALNFTALCDTLADQQVAAHVLQTLLFEK